MRIITMDGGGVRGVISAVLLMRLNDEMKSLFDKTDFYAGTSTGGLIALALANNMDIRDVINIYEDQGSYIFADSFWDDIKDAYEIFGAKYGIQNLYDVMTKTFGTLKLGQLKKKVMVTAYDLNGLYKSNHIKKPKFFQNFDGTDDDILVADAGCATAAAPTYFPTFKTFIDGGVFAGNPSMCALAQVGFDKDIKLLSIGTGGYEFMPPTEGGDHDWGIWGWYNNGLIDILLNSNKDVARYITEKLLGDNQFRLNPSLDKQIAMDEYKEVPYMINFAMNIDISETLNWLKEKW